MRADFSKDPDSEIQCIDFRGEIQPGELKAYVQELIANPDFAAGDPLLVDFTQATLNANYDSALTFNDFMQTNAEAFAGSRWAVLPGKILNRGMVNRHLLLAQEDAIQKRLFTDRAEALQWLRGIEPDED